MGKIQTAQKAKLFVGVLYSDSKVMEDALKALNRTFGEIDIETREFDFSFTDFYAEEMGKKLKKKFISFKRPIDRKKIVDAKIFTNELEEKYMEKGRRKVNIDPGYITKDSIIYASVKERPHRIYIDRGIYGDFQGYFSKGDVIPLSYTFPDIKQNRDFFLKLREKILE